MAMALYIGRRLSFEGSLCTVRYIGKLEGAKDEWIGVEWDDTSRGKHDGKYKGKQIFECLSSSKTSASFVKPSRKADSERTVLQAIQFKYGGGLKDGVSTADVVVISGKVAEEVGFEKIAREQAQLADLRVVLIDQLVVNGVAPRGAPPELIHREKHELAQACPNITELDLGWNTIEDWQDVACICSALPKLRTLKTSGLRFHSFTHNILPNPFSAIKELHLAECMLSPAQFYQILYHTNGLPNLEILYLSQNQLNSLLPPHNQTMPCIQSLTTLILENDLFTSLDCVETAVALFPQVKNISLQGNRIERVGLEQFEHNFPQIDTLNLSNNAIASFDFIDSLPSMFPNLSSLRVTNNPLFSRDEFNTLKDPRASDKSFYLVLARIPSLKTLNYAKISHRDREEGEMYYLSVAERELKKSFSPGEEASKMIDHARKLYPRYETLVTKYGRDSIFELYSSNNQKSKDNAANAFRNNEPTFPAGSLGARLINATFKLQNQESRAQPIAETSLQLPSSLPTTRLMSILQHHPAFNPHLKPLGFKLIYESKELDPVDTTAESSTRSNIYGKNLTTEEKQAIWREWGDWDADAMVEEQLHAAGSDSGNVHDDTASSNALTTTNTTVTAGGTGTGTGTTASNDQAEHWIEGGKYCIKEGRRWKRREVEIPHALKRPWGDWIDDARDVTIRIEPFVKAD